MLNNLISKLTQVSFWLLTALIFLTPMELGDIWWHLKYGQWILQHRTLPVEDPFSLAIVKGSFVHGAFWIAQILFYLVHSATGEIGLILLKAALFTATFVIIYRTLGYFIKTQSLRFLILLPAIIIATSYDEIRPQDLSFLFFAYTLMVLECRRTQKGLQTDGRQYFLLPAVFLAWANIHGGFVIGMGLIFVYTMEEILAGRGNPHHLRRLFIYVLSMLLTYLNPNGWAAFNATFSMLRKSAAGKSVIHEHLPTVEFVSLTGEIYLYYSIVAIIIIVSIAFVLSFLKTRRIDLLHLAIFAGLSVAALDTFRAGLFLALFAIVAFGKNISSLASDDNMRIDKYALPSVAIVTICAVFIFALPRSIIRKDIINKNLLPVAIANHIYDSDLPGNLFHPYEWGGYFIWRLAPKYRVFIDGRAIGLSKEYNTVVNADPGWETILDAHDVRTVVYWPLLPFKNKIPPIVIAMLKDDGWSPEYGDFQSVAFVRSYENRPTIRKGAVWELLISLLRNNMAKDSPKASDYINLAEAYNAWGKVYLAREALETALRIEPGNRDAAIMLELLDSSSNNK